MINLKIKTNGTVRNLTLPYPGQSIPDIIEKNSVVTVSEVTEPESLKYMEGHEWNIDEINFLAKRMESFDKREKRQFDAIASQLKPSTGQDLINQTFNLSRYTLISDFSSLTEIGKTHIINRKQAMSFDEMASTDFAKIGKDLIESGKGIPLGDEMLLNTFTAIAQEESIAISERIRYSNTKRMESGDFIDGNAPYGYRMVDRVLFPKEDEAQIVRDIFDQYLKGASTHEIARNLNDAGIPGKFGSTWKVSTIRYILRNEKYIGDMLCQKTYHTNTLPFKQKRNRGEADQYYVEGSHEGIVDKNVFQKAQEIINSRKEKYLTDADSIQYPLTSKMHCTECGAFFIRKKTNGCVSWVCSNHGISKDNCPTHYIREIRIYDAFVCMINKLRFSQEQILDGVIKRLDEAIRRYRLNNADAYAISQQISEINAKLLMMEQLHQKQYLATDVYRMQSNELQSQITKLKAQRVQMLSSKLEDAKTEIEKVSKAIGTIKEPLEEFDEELFKIVIEQISIDKNDNITFTLKGNISFTEEL